MFIIRVLTGFVIFIANVLLSSLWVAICGLSSYYIGKGINKFLIKKTFGISNFFGITGALAFGCLSINFIAKSFFVKRGFYINLSEWWYNDLLSVGAIASIVGIVCLLIFGLLGGKVENADD